MRNYLVAILALPVYGLVYATAALQRSLVARFGVAVALGAFVGLGVVSLARPTTTTATPPSQIVPLTGAAFTTTVSTGVSLDAPMTIAFTTPMAESSVAESISVDPPVPVSLAWDATDTTLTVSPTTHWRPSTYHTVTVDAGALAQTGRPLTTPARTSFLTRAATTVTITASDAVGDRVPPSSVFTIAFGAPVDPSSVAASITLEPEVEGTVTETGTADAPSYTFTPAAALDADTAYRLVVDGVRDADGVPVDPTALEVRTAAAPEVVRFRPRDGTEKVARNVAISVRFTESMDRTTTKKAFTVAADGKAITGKIRFAEDDTVLVFIPSGLLPYDAKVVATVAATATSKTGAALDAKTSGTFETAAKPKPKPKPKTGDNGGGGGGGGGGSVGSGSWGAVERYYLGLMNCTRTGGWVSSSGKCTSPGGRNVAALSLSSGISSKVSRPYAKKLAVNNQCSHFIGGNPGDRLRRAGYTSYRWAENIGCRSGNPYSAVLGSHRFFQSEKSYNGGHYVNLMNAKYDRVGIGVWVSHGRVRLVIDFYHP